MDVSRTITFPDRRFPDKTLPRQDVSQIKLFPDKTFPRQSLSWTRRFPERRFPDVCVPWLVDYFSYKTFPGQSLSQTDISRTDVSWTICINNFEYFGVSCSKINDELSCAKCTYDYMLLIISSVCIIIFLSLLSVCVAIIFHLIIIKFTLYPLLDYTPYRIVPVYLLQAYNFTSTHQ